MCEKCEAQRANFSKQALIGVISAVLLAELNAHGIAEKNAELDIDQLVLNARRDYLNDKISEVEAKERQDAIRKQHEENHAKFGEQHTALWNRVYDELGLVGLDRGLEYTVDNQTGEVRRSAGKDQYNPFSFLADLAAGAAEVHIIRKK